MEGHLIHDLLNLEASLFVRELGQVVGSLRVVRGQCLVHGGLLLFLSKVLLCIVDGLLVSVISVENFIIVLDIITGFVFGGALRLLFLLNLLRIRHTL